MQKTLLHTDTLTLDGLKQFARKVECSASMEGLFKQIEAIQRRDQIITEFDRLRAKGVQAQVAKQILADKHIESVDTIHAIVYRYREKPFK